MKRNFLVAAICVLALIACSKSFRLVLPEDATVLNWSDKNYVLGQSHPISPEGHAAVENWLAHNQNGWKPYLVTVPASGIFIQAKTFSLQITRSSALLYINEDVYSKGLSDSVGAALLAANDA